jgi:hypothetical protein
MRRTRLALIRGVSTLLVSTLASAAQAQDSARAQPTGDVMRKPVACSGQRVNDIVIRSFAPTTAALRSVPVIADIARSVHATTRPDLIRRYLLMARGDTCTELRRSESERILRAQPFLADASVLAYPADSGAVDLDVRTIDETSAIIAGTVTSASPYLTAARVGSSNLGGGGIYLAGNWRHDPNFRDGFGVRFTDYQLGALPYILNFEAQQDPLGNHLVISAAHPFLTDLQRVAWSGVAGSTDDYVFFSTSQDIQHAFNSQRNFFDVGGLVRVGPPGRLSLFGASISGEQEMPGLAPILVTPAGPLVDTTTAFANRYTQHRIARANLLWGVRDIGFVRVTGFDALTATQDIPVGFQLGTQFGRSLTVLGARDDDVFMSGDLYVGAARENAATRVQIQGEGRRSNDLNAWDGVVTSGRATQYVKVSDWQTAIASIEWSSGWRLRVPFALTLGEQRGGVRGYADETRPGGQRGIVRLEDRLVVGRPFGLGDAGIGFFADAGRLWAGDVLFGESTPVRASMGFSILASVPPRSARLWRLDIAVPINPAGPRRLELRITSNDQTTFFWREPDDVQIAREKTVPSSIFNWP